VLAKRAACKVVGNDATAEDIAAETLARALVAWHRVEGYAAPFVMRVATNLALDEVRRRKPRFDPVPQAGSGTTGATGTTGTATTTTGTTGPTGTTTTVPAPQTYSNSLHDVVAPGTLQGSQWTVPEGDQFDLTSFTLSTLNDASAMGDVRVQLLSPGSAPQSIVEVSLGSLAGHPQKESLATPMVFSAGQSLDLAVTCDSNQAACDVSLDFSGTLAAGGSTTTTTPTTTSTTIPFS
jgi:hypothetical protein